jgi:hypothetical protein
MTLKRKVAADQFRTSIAHEVFPLTPDELYKKTNQLVKLQTLVEYIDETDTRSLTTSGADFLDEVKRLIDGIKADLGLKV